MPNWFKKKTDDELPKELEGLTPEQVVEKLKAAEELGKKVTALEADKTTRDAQVATLASQFDQVKQKLVETEANYNKLKNPDRQEEPADWNIEPEKAFHQQITPLVNVVSQNAAMSARLLAIQSLDSADAVSPADKRTMDGRLFRAWEAEIDGEAKKYPASQMGQPDRWLGLYFLVKGRHTNELMDADTRKKKYNFLEPATQGAPPPSPTPKDGVESLTDQEKHVAEKMGVKLEDYAKRKKSMQFIPG